MRNINWNSIGNFAGKVCDMVACGLLVVASRKMVDCAVDDYVSAFAGYDDAVSAIMKSGMYSHDKCEAVAILKRKEDREYYKAIIHVAQDSRLYSHDKVKLITGLSEN